MMLCHVQFLQFLNWPWILYIINVITSFARIHCTVDNSDELFYHFNLLKSWRWHRVWTRITVRMNKRVLKLGLHVSLDLALYKSGIHMCITTTIGSYSSDKCINYTSDPPRVFAAPFKFRIRGWLWWIPWPIDHCWYRQMRLGYLVMYYLPLQPLGFQPHEVAPNRSILEDYRLAPMPFCSLHPPKLHELNPVNTRKY